MLVVIHSTAASYDDFLVTFYERPLHVILHKCRHAVVFSVNVVGEYCSPCGSPGAVPYWP